MYVYRNKLLLLLLLQTYLVIAPAELLVTTRLF